MKSILHVPKIKKNLLSVSSLLSKNDIIIKFFGDKCCAKDKRQGILLLEGLLKHSRLFQLICPAAQIATSNFL